MHSHTLRNVALSLVTMAACAASMAAEPLLLAKANVAATSQLLRMSAPAVAGYPTVADADAERMIAGYADFDAVLTAALGTPTAAGFVAPASRAAVEQMAARLMPAMVP